MLVRIFIFLSPFFVLSKFAFLLRLQLQCKLFTFFTAHLWYTHRMHRTYNGIDLHLSVYIILCIYSFILFSSLYGRFIISKSLYILNEIVIIVLYRIAVSVSIAYHPNNVCIVQPLSQYIRCHLQSQGMQLIS